MVGALFHCSGQHRVGIWYVGWCCMQMQCTIWRCDKACGWSRCEPFGSGPGFSWRSAIRCLPTTAELIPTRSRHQPDPGLTPERGLDPVERTVRETRLLFLRLYHSAFRDHPFLTPWVQACGWRGHNPSMAFGREGAQFVFVKGSLVDFGCK